MERCTHTVRIRDVQPSTLGRKECLEIADTWVHLREYLVYGHVGRCDSSKCRHIADKPSVEIMSQCCIVYERKELR